MKSHAWHTSSLFTASLQSSCHPANCSGFVQRLGSRIGASRSACVKMQECDAEVSSVPERVLPGWAGICSSGLVMGVEAVLLKAVAPTPGGDAPMGGPGQKGGSR